MVMARTSIMPNSRRDDLVVQDLSGESLVYDLKTHRAHCLNKTAAFVWANCDGRTSYREVADKLSGEMDVPSDESVVRLAVDQLRRARLVEGDVTADAINAGRRNVIRKLGLAAGVAAALPLVTSIVAPTSALAQTRGAPCEGACKENADCANRSSERGGPPCVCGSIDPETGEGICVEGVA